MRLAPRLWLATLLLASPAARAEPAPILHEAPPAPVLHEAPPAPVLQQQSTHILVGRIWVPDGGYFVSAGELVRRASTADVLLLGETHDNPDHHVLQAWLLDRYIAAGKRPLLAFEMMDASQSTALADHLARHPGDAAGIGPAIGWEKGGWPDWALYRPLAETALKAGAPLAAASLTKEDTRAIAKGNPPEELVAALGLERPLPAEIRQAMEAEIKASHCDMLPDKALPAMVRVQRARDSHMARIVADGLAAQGSAVLIAGSGHVRADRAVPAILGEMARGKQAFAVAFVEIQDEKTDPAAYADAFGTARPPFDALWFTPRHEREDQCEVMRKHMEKKGP